MKHFWVSIKIVTYFDNIMLKKGPAMVLIKGEMVHLLKVYIFIVFQYANSMNMEAFPTHAALIWKWQKWTTFLGLKT